VLFGGGGSLSLLFLPLSLVAIVAFLLKSLSLPLRLCSSDFGIPDRGDDQTADAHETDRRDKGICDAGVVSDECEQTCRQDAYEDKH
jgi:hypothetical protein